MATAPIGRVLDPASNGQPAGEPAGGQARTGSRRSRRLRQRCPSSLAGAPASRYGSSTPSTATRRRSACSDDARSRPE